MTGTIIPLESDRHREIQALLPWHLAGLLDEAEHEKVRQHLSICPECQAEATAERRLAAEVVDLPQAEPATLDVEDGWSAVRRRIAQETPAAVASPGWLARVGTWIADQWRVGSPWMRWALVAQSCLLLTLAAVLWRSQAPPAYSALGAGRAGAAGNIVVMFRPDTRESDMRRILDDNRLRLVDGPTSAGAYVIHAQPDERAAALSALRRREQVVLAEQIDAGVPD